MAFRVLHSTKATRRMLEEVRRGAISSLDRGDVQRALAAGVSATRLRSAGKPIMTEGALALATEEAQRVRLRRALVGVGIFVGGRLARSIHHLKATADEFERHRTFWSRDVARDLPLHGRLSDGYELFR